MSGNEKMKGPYAGSAMHVLDWLESSEFVDSVQHMIATTGLAVSNTEQWQPKGYADSRESVLVGKDDPFLSTAQCEELLDWWLVHRRGAKMPTWDLIMPATTATGTPALILFEAKGHGTELSSEGKKPPVRDTPEAQARSDENHAQIGAAIQQASTELGRSIQGISIALDASYQFSNRIAFAWKLASMGIPVALVYLGFVGDSEIAPLGDYFANDEEWDTVFQQYIQPHFPLAKLEQEIDCGKASFWLLSRSLPCLQQSPPRAQRQAAYAQRGRVSP